jgi:nitrite reductase/ring-hydroxylating ferredoxin subunit
MPFVKAASVAALPAGSMVEKVIGEDLYVVCNVEGTLHAMDGRCPHAGGPLGQGALHGPIVTCPWHSWEFDCRTGETDFNPRFNLQTFPVRVEGDDILIDARTS